MGYDQDQYRQTRGGYQGDYYDDSRSQQYVGPPQQRGLNRFASQPGMSLAYRQGGGGRHPPPPPLPHAPSQAGMSSNPDGQFSYRGPVSRREVPPRVMTLDDSMQVMNLNGGGPHPQMRQQGPQGRGVMPRSQTTAARGRPPPDFRGEGGGGGSLRYHTPLSSPGMRGPPPPHQRMPPPRGNMPGPMVGRRGPPPSGRPPPRQNPSYPDQGWSEPYGNQLNGRYDDDVPEPGFAPPQRSMTMPLSTPQTEPQYTAYNPTRHGTPVNFSSPRAYPPRQVMPHDEYSKHPADFGGGQELHTDSDRGSVGVILDYYAAADYAGEYDQQQYASDQQGGYPVGGGVDPAYGMNGDSYGYQQEPYQETHGGRDFAQQAHRSRSQPDLRGQARGGGTHPPLPDEYGNASKGNTYRPEGPLDGAVEMPAEVPPEAPPVMTANGFPPPPPIQSDLPIALRVGSPAQQMRSQPPPQQHMPPPQMAYPPRTHSAQSSDSLPHHPDPPGPTYATPDFLPAHPVPVRPGLMQDQAPGKHPPPIRQYSPDRASTLSRQPAEPGMVTQIELNQLQQAVKANPGDQKTQLLLVKKMVEAAVVLADEGGRADAKTTKRNRENYIFDAHKILKKLTNSAHAYPEAMFYLADCYWEGLLGLQVDHDRAFNLYQSAAKLNHGPSAYRTAVCCELGAGVRKDPLKSITWYKKGAALGDTAAMYKLGMVQLKGLLGQAKNPRDALNWLKRAADQADENNPHALHQLGLLYEVEGGDPSIIPDQNYARELFMKAAELGYPPSQFRIGCAFEYGTMGCPIDPRQSITWYSQAAMQGEEESALALSGWYLTGAEGVIKQSDTEAYLWARKAAENGLGNAEYALGYFTEVGIGVASNLEEAKRWYYKAASQQHEKARQRLSELKKGGAAVQRSRERLSRSHVKNKDGDCIIM